MKAGKTETVKVAIRVRPMNAKEKSNNSVNCVDVDKDNNQINLVKPDNNQTNTFQYDYVYPPTISQRCVYDETAFPIVEAVIQGYNGTIFAYGQTGCGKTFTMMGDFANPEKRGIIPNAFEHIFGYINSESSKKKFLVRCSFLEIYNEEIRDLLGKDTTKKLDIREDPKTGVFVKDLNHIQMKCTKDLENELNKGFNNRHVGETSMNKESSRSHCIFSVYIESGELNSDSKNQKIKAGKLNLVDLAGSERQSKTGVTGERLEEAKKINLSLTALSNVIKALADQKSHVPYRDSKLTRLLQDSLGGNTKTLMIAAVSPSSYNYEETFGTLRYASRANAIKNAPKINEDPKDALLRQYEEQIRLLKEQLEQSGNGGTVVYKEIESKKNNNNIQEEESNYDSDNENSNKKHRDKYLREKENIIANSKIEKQKLLERINELENDIGKRTVDAGDVKNDKEMKKFKEFREKNIKKEEELRKKQDILVERKKDEDEILDENKKFANVQQELEEKNKLMNKMKNKIRHLENEIKDLKFENEIEREENTYALKEYYKDFKFYQGVTKFILTEKELKSIVELSKWKEDNEEWRIQPFNFREKKINLPSIRPHQVNEFIENELSNRDLVLDDSANSPKNNKNSFKEYKDFKEFNKEPMFNGNSQINYRETRNNFHNINMNKARFDECPPDLFTHPQVMQNRGQQNPNNKNCPKQTNINQNINLNTYIINKKEAKKYEELLKYSNPTTASGNDSNNINNQHSNSVKPIKMGKVILEPINNNNNLINNSGNPLGGFNNGNINNNKNMNELNQTKKNFYSSKNKKMEVSFKATLKFSDDIGNNKIEISPNFNLNNKENGS